MSKRACKRQDGVALVVSLILLLVVTVASLSAVRYSSLELLIARNDEYRLSAYQQAQSLVDATVTIGVPATGSDGTVSCTSTAIPNSGCSTTGVQTLTLPTTVLPTAEVDPAADNHQTVVIKQIGHSLPTPRRLRGSGQHLESSRWVIAADYDHNKAGQGRSQIHQGFYQEYGSSRDDSLYGE